MPNTVFASAQAAAKSIKDNKWEYTLWDDKEKKAKTATFSDKDKYLEGYAEIAAFLCNGAEFERALNTVSEELWDAYRVMYAKTRNKFTGALNAVASKKGFVFQNRLSENTSHSRPIGIKLIGGDPQLGYMLRNKLFWKDSMDLHHGEHTHSLQWLAIAQGVQTTVPIAELYAHTGAFRAPSDVDPGGDRSLLMWQWLADCFPSSMKSLATLKFKNGETLESQSYRSPQVITDYLLNRQGGPIDGHFISTYLFHRYKNRNWLTTKDIYDKDQQKHVEKLDKIYQGDPKVPTKGGSFADDGWVQSPSSPNRLLRDKASYQTLHSSSPNIEYPVQLHQKAGTLCFYYGVQ